jgi:hypothetical protein
MSLRRRRRGSNDWKKSENWAELMNFTAIHHGLGLARTGQSLYGAAALGILP